MPLNKSQNTPKKGARVRTETADSIPIEKIAKSFSERLPNSNSFLHFNLQSPKFFTTARVHRSMPKITPRVPIRNKRSNLRARELQTKFPRWVCEGVYLNNYRRRLKKKRPGERKDATNLAKLVRFYCTRIASGCNERLFRFCFHTHTRVYNLYAVEPIRYSTFWSSYMDAKTRLHEYEKKKKSVAVIYY